ncbi:MAG: KamA family radical SAM protein [Planctomycetales bacterium]|nr:KamA family radical SAM protein [Planctomycetales bacterium]MCA9168258.1 KamA family radical SAM protein [Planctomycetales bacterium]
MQSEFEDANVALSESQQDDAEPPSCVRVPAVSLRAKVEESTPPVPPVVLTNEVRVRDESGDGTLSTISLADLAPRVEVSLHPDSPITLRATHSSRASNAYQLSCNDRTLAFRRRHFPEVSDAQWSDWRWQSQHRLRKLEQFERLLRLSADEREALVRGGQLLPVGVTPYYLSLLDAEDAEQPLRRTVIPSTAEFLRSRGEADDPLGEDGHSPVPGLVHRYPDRVLLLPLDFCSTYCRYCTRSRVVGHGEIVPNEQRLEAIFQYLRQATNVRDVLISGGDPLALSDDKLDWILTRLREIPHIEFVRIGTKMPAVLPQRITPELVAMLRKHHPLWMSIHFLHPDECTVEAKQACERLIDAGIPLGSQTVLLRGVNDSVDTMKQLVHRLLLMRVRPYYLYQCDPISGSAHFRTPVSKGLEIIRGLRGHTTGYAAPTYVIDAPGGGGKIVVQDTTTQRDGDWVVLTNFEGREFRYLDPVEEVSHGE